MKKLLLPLLIIIAGIGISRTYFMKQDIAERYSLPELQGIAVGANKTLPIMVDEITRFEKVTAADKLLEKHYTLLSIEKSALDVANFRNQMEITIINQACQNAQSLNLFNSGVSEWYTYHDKNNEFITTIKTSLQDCK